MTKLEQSKLDVRIMKEEDLGGIIDIDTKVMGTERRDYYERKMHQMLDEKGSISTSLVAEYDGNVIGFIMGNIFTGEFGIPQSAAFLDTIGVDPDYVRAGIGTQLLEEFVRHIKVAGAQTINTLVDWDNTSLMKFFHRGGFEPSNVLNLEKKI